MLFTLDLKLGLDIQRFCYAYFINLAVMLNINSSEIIKTSKIYLIAIRFYTCCRLGQDLKIRFCDMIGVIVMFILLIQVQCLILALVKLLKLVRYI